MSSPAAYLDELRGLVNGALDRLFRDASAPPLIVEAVRYALLGSGKRLRPCLALATAEAVALHTGADVETARVFALPGACALEMVHAYSLVHDDLPAMDNDDLRRGRPTSHVVYGDGLAILAGDGLVTEAFGLIAHDAPPVLPAGAPILAAPVRLRLIAILAHAAGLAGMVGGQAIDLAAAGSVRDRQLPPFDGATLQDLHARKTGALIRAAVTMGAVAAGADDGICAAADEYARELGLAFQILDDILDVEGSNAELGKTAGKDAAAKKVTYPSLYGLARSRALSIECVARAKLALTRAGLGGQLAAIADWSLERRS